MNFYYKSEALNLQKIMDIKFKLCAAYGKDGGGYVLRSSLSDYLLCRTRQLHVNVHYGDASICRSLPVRSGSEGSN